MGKRDDERKQPSLFPPHDLWQIARGDFGPPRDTPAVVAVREWMRTGEFRRRPWALVMIGDTGVGKSVAAALAWLMLRDEDRTIAQAPGVFDDLRGVAWVRARSLQRLSWEQRAEVLQRCAAAHGLVVDEMGSEDKNTREALLEVLEERGDAKRRTVMTSNLDANQFVEVYGDRFIDRLRAAGLTGSGKSRWLKVFRGASLRGVERTANDPPPAAEVERRATAEFMDGVLRDAPAGVAEMLAPIVEAQRAEGSEG